MTLNCSSNAALDKLQASKDAMQAKLDSLISSGSSALADVKAQADQIKADLLAALPEIPELPNLKKELAELQTKLQTATGEQLATLKNKFREKWGDSIPDLDTMIAGVEYLAAIAANPLAALNIDLGGFSICDSVPNTDAPEVIDGKVTKVIEKAKEPTTPDDNAKQSEPIVPTIVETENQVVEGFTKSAKQIKDDYNTYLYGTWVPPVFEEGTTKIVSGGMFSGGYLQVDDRLIKSLILNEGSNELQGLRNKYYKKLKRMWVELKKDEEYTKASNYFNDGKMKSKYHANFKSYAAARYDSEQLKHYNTNSNTARKYFERIITGELVVEEDTIFTVPVGPEAEEHIKFLYALRWWRVEDGVAKWINYPRADDLFEKIKTHVNNNSQVILDKYNYDNGITPT